MKYNLMSTAIGSMPFTDPDYAVKVSLESLDAPIWPQLSSRSLLEQMEIQYSENIPCAVIDHQKKRMFYQTDSDYSEAFAEFYENYEAGNFESMAISEEYSQGIYALLKAVEGKGKRPWLKVQTTGPCSIALTVVDENKRAMYYNEEFRDIITKAVIMKSRWQIQKFKPYAENIICFVDEPILSGFGSSTYVSVKTEDVVEILNEVTNAIHEDGAQVGVHCCGNTEWSILIDAGVDIVNFDAFEFAHTIAMYADKVKMHLERGGGLAWGVVPTSALIREQTVDSLEAKLEAGFDMLIAKGIDKNLIISQALLTPSCGTGSLSTDDAEKVFSLLKQLTKRMKEKYKV